MLVARRRLAALLTAAALAAPSAALAQSAGDEQYEDPFAGEDQGQSQGDQGTEPAAPTAPTAPAPEPAPSTSGGAAPAAQAELPRTGSDTDAILIAGVALLAGGVALRVRAREPS